MVKMESEDSYNITFPKKSKIFGIDRYTYSYEYVGDDPNKEYTVILIGASRCGKSTLINCMANFFMDFKSISIEKRYEYKVDKSNREEFCFYTFYTKDSVINVIDSPSITNDAGFVDTKCQKQFKEILKQVRKSGYKIHAFGLVIQNHFVRLPPAEENMLQFVRDLVGEANVFSHIIPFITYADANTPPVLDALKAHGIDTEKHLVFNNVHLNPTTKEIGELEEYWCQRSLENVKNGIDIIMKLGPIYFPQYLFEDNFRSKYIPEKVGNITKREIAAISALIGAIGGYLRYRWGTRTATSSSNMAIITVSAATELEADAIIKKIIAKVSELKMPSGNIKIIIGEMKKSSVANCFQKIKALAYGAAGFIAGIAFTTWNDRESSEALGIAVKKIAVQSRATKKSYF